MKTALLLVALLSACSGGGTVGLYDPVRVMRESASARAALEEAEKAVPGFEAVKKAAGAAAAAERTLPISDAVLQERRAAAEKLVTKYNDDMSAARRAVLAKIDEKVRGIAAKIAGQRKMYAVMGFSGGSPAYAAPGVDITNEIIASLDVVSEELARARKDALAAAEKVKQIESSRTP